MKRSMPKRAYTPEYREAAVRQVIDAGLRPAHGSRQLGFAFESA